MNTIKPKLKFLYFLIIALAACGNDSDNPENNSVATKNNSIQNSELVSPSGCIDISLYTQRLKTLAPETPTLNAAVNMQQVSKKTPRHNFEILTAYSTFTFKYLPIANAAEEFAHFTQEECKTINHAFPDGEVETYTIKKFSNTMLIAESPSGLRFELNWLSPNSVEIKQHYKIYDAPCTANSGFVTITKVLDWSPSQPILIPSNSHLNISDEYLSLVAQATNTNIADLYQTTVVDAPTQPIQNSLIFSKLIELNTLPINPDVLSCSDVIESPEIPDPIEDPNPNE